VKEDFWLRLDSGWLHTNGEWISAFVPIETKVGDFIKLEIKGKEMSYYINEVSMGVAFKDERLLETGLFPFICLYDSGDIVRVVN